MIELDSENLTIVKTPEAARTSLQVRLPKTLLAALCLAIFGVALRLWMPVGFHGRGFDEALYQAYVNALDQRGLWDYDTITQEYLDNQRKEASVCKLPPTRFLYVFAGWVWKHVEFGDAPALDPRAPGSAEHDPALISLHRVACLFSILCFLLSGVIAWRMLGREAALVVLALMAAAPLQLHMGGHALVDGFFAFWAMLVLWSLWENLQQPNHAGWLATLGLAMTAMVITKENSFFVTVAVFGLLGINRWVRFGRTTRPLIIVSLLGPALGVAILAHLAGGVTTLVEVYRVLVSKAEHLDYAILTGDGPWHRYLIDEIIANPIVLCLAIGAAFGLARKERPILYFTAFVVFTYAVMCQVRHGMNLRYATIWDLPLCALAAAQLLDLSKLWMVPRKRFAALAISVAIICGYDLWQYWLFFVKDRLYEIPTESLLHAVDILKS